MLYLKTLIGISLDIDYCMKMLKKYKDTFNIKTVTLSDNSLDIPKEKRVLNASNPKHDHEKIIQDFKNGYKYKEIMEKYGIKSKGTISFIINKSLKSDIVG